MNVAERIGNVVRQTAIVGVEILAIGTETHKIGAHKVVDVAVAAVTKAGEVYKLAADKLDEFLDEVQGSLAGRPGA